MSQSQRSRRNKNPSQQNPENEERSEADQSSIEDLSEKCVRFLLTKMGSNLPIKRSDIVQHVFQEKPGKSFNLVMASASKYLNEIYGLNVELIDSDSSVKKYFISNKLPYSYMIPNDFDSDLKTTITFLILAHIFMSKNNSTDTSLWQFLEEFDITPTTNCESVGNMNTFVMQTLVKQNYVALEDRGGEHDDGEQKKRLKWGSRADEVVSKREILKFVSQLYDNQAVELWNEQYKAANEQFAGCDNQE